MVLSSLPVQAKTRLHSISGIASTARVMTQGEIASTACGRPQTEFSQIFSYGTSVKIGLHKGKNPPNPLFKKLVFCSDMPCKKPKIFTNEVRHPTAKFFQKKFF